MTLLLEVKNLKKYYPIKRGLFKRHIGNVKAVDNICFDIAQGETVGLVGESGSGKSTAGRASIRLIEPTDGEIFFCGLDLRKMDKKRLRDVRRHAQIVFQDPYASLNPRKTILENVGESLLVHKIALNREQQKKQVAHLLDKVGISTSAFNQYPHQFSGGQQQRISLARALILKPKLLICDEITSALDVSIQAQVLNLLNDLKKTLHLSYLLISHDLAVVRYLCDRVFVMHQGKIVEGGPTETLFQKPQHPYTQLLLSSIPIIHPKFRLQNGSMRDSQSVQ